jgi:hypothetical protein
MKFLDTEDVRAAAARHESLSEVDRVMDDASLPRGREKSNPPARVSSVIVAFFSPNGHPAGAGDRISADCWRAGPEESL